MGTTKNSKLQKKKHCEFGENIFSLKVTFLLKFLGVTLPLNTLCVSVVICKNVTGKRFVITDNFLRPELEKIEDGGAD